MKLNRKLFVSSLVLLGLSTVAMSTATYAWFTVDKTASMTASATIKADAGVEIGSLESGGHAAVDYSSSGTIALGAHKLTDISGNGSNFYKPVFASDNTSFSTVNDLKFTYKDNFITVALKFRADKAYKVYLGKSSDIMSGDLAACSWMALFDGGKVSTNSVTPAAANLKQVVYSGDYEDPQYYLNGTTATSTTTSYTPEGGEKTTATGYTTWQATATSLSNSNLVHSDVVESTYDKVSSATTAGLNALTTLQDEGSTYNIGTTENPNNVELYTGIVIVVIWVEGVDKDCVNTAISGSLSVTLPFQFLLA